MNANMAMQKEAIIFGIDNNTSDNFSIMILKEPEDQGMIDEEDNIEFYVNVYLEAQGYVEYRSAVLMPDRRVIIYVGDENTGQQEMWDITKHVVYPYRSQESFNTILETSIDELKKCAFVIDQNEQGDYELVDKFSEDVIEPILHNHE